MEELKDFIRQSLFEITQGIHEANEEFRRARGQGGAGIDPQNGTV